MNSTDILRTALRAKLQATNPTSPAESVESTVSALIELGAYVTHDGARLTPVGSRSTMTRATLLAPALAAAVTRESVAAAAASSSPETAAYDRSRARLAAMGIDIDAALAGDDGDGATFMGFTQAEIDGMGPRGGSAA
jgi:hypothetical protein